MNGRELYEAIFSGGTPDRLPLPSVGGYRETRDRWLAEGAESLVEDDPDAAVGLTSDDSIGLPLNLSMVPEFEIRVLKKEDERVTLVDEYGVTKTMMRRDFDASEGRVRKSGLTSSMSQWIDFPVKDMRSWKAIYEERFRPDPAERLPADWGEEKAAFIRRSETRNVSFGGFPFFGTFGPLRQLMGLEGLVYALADDPALVRTILSDLTDFWLALFGEVLKDIRLDQVMFFEDMCSTRTPLISPAMFREFMAPAYRKATGGLREMGVSWFILDTDGNARRIIPELVACGITTLIPCQVSAGMDVAELRSMFPALSLIGGIDKRALARDPAAIDAELRRCFTVAWQAGKYIPKPDHGATPDVSWANIQYFAQRVLQWCAGPHVLKELP